MEVFEAISERKSIRAYKEQEVEEEKLTRVLEAARLSPSASNRQEWKFIVVKNGATRKKLAAASYGQRFVGEAPVIIVACATETKAIMTCGQPAHTVDLSIACTHIILEAWEQGLGTCWLGTFNEAEVKEILAIPDRVRVVTMTPLGYPNEPGRPKARKTLDQIICAERYS
jgi:nitroreductase